MNNKQLWDAIYQSVCQIVIIRNGQRISSGTGFMTKLGIVTNHHVIDIPSYTDVEVRFVNPDCYTVRKIKRYSKTEFTARITFGDGKEGWDYCMLDMASELSEVRPIVGRRMDNIPIGTPVCSFGYHFDNGNLSINTGYISSKYIDNGVKIVQIDGTVNNGCSGGPLICGETGELCGIITRKATGLTRGLAEMKRAIEGNLESLKTGVGIVNLGGPDLFSVFLSFQAQIKQTILELERSANVGIGYAFELDELIKQFPEL